MNYLELKDFRKKYKLTQSELAEIVKSSTRAVQSWEQNQRNIPLSAIALLENYKISQNDINEITSVPEDDYMMVEYEDLETAAGMLGGGIIDLLPEKKKRLIPKEYAEGNYLVVRVSGHSMDDGTKRSISEGEEILIKECYENDFNLPIRNKLFVIVTKEGSVIKQISKIDKEENYIICHSFNPTWEDFKLSFSEILQIFTVEKKVKSNIIF